MSRPSNPLHGGGWKSYDREPEPEPEPKPTQPKPAPPKKVPRVRVEPSKKRQQAVNKLLLSTEALSAEERQIIQGYRISRRDLGMED